MGKFHFIPVLLATALFVIPACSKDEGPVSNVSVDTSGMSPEEKAFHAAGHGDVNTLKEVLGADTMLVDAKNETGASLLHVAMESKNPSVVKYLVEQGADIDAQDAQGRTPDAYGKELNVPEKVREALYQ